MSADIRDELLRLSEDLLFDEKEDLLLFKKAIQSLFENTQQVVSLHRKRDFDNELLPLPESYLAEAVNGFFENGGIRCYVARAVPESDKRKEALIQALNVLEPLNDIDLVAIPDAMTLHPDRQAIIDVQQAALQHCATCGDRIAILDALPSLENGQPKLTLKDEVIWQHDRLVNQQEVFNGVLYFPWLKNAQDYPKQDNQLEKGRLVPPCGHVAGIIARSDRNRGVFKAPANEEIYDALDLEVPVDNSIQDELNPLGINCLRAFPGRGIRVWGARTLAGNDPNWRYVNVRRLFLTLTRWIDQNMFWATFEPNGPLLWLRIQRELSFHLETFWQAGALQGETRQQAFYVKCDEETNPLENRETGQVVTEIGLAPNAPAEFIIVRIVHRISAPEIIQPYI
ncbi:MAG: phage tail sheath family protein [Scytonema sp. RU_4_4]|nr:phage tail sheath family protein [Scytonema sp. RU_4_4]NJR76383.1 phage tail sheath family protein [Scytonema sp. CRU_2_7]